MLECVFCMHIAGRRATHRMRVSGRIGAVYFFLETRFEPNFMSDFVIC